MIEGYNFSVLGLCVGVQKKKVMANEIAGFGGLNLFLFLFYFLKKNYFE